MGSNITIAAVGDILMIGKLIASARRADGTYSFDSIFRETAPYLRRADLTIGNLETPLAGKEQRYTRPNPKTGFSMFNCPDELAPALKNAGFDVVTTANNHCMDRGEEGLIRTLEVLDKYGLKHTGTYVSAEEADNDLILDIKGIRIGILAYSKSTNKIPLPERNAWQVNLLDERKIVSDMKRIKPKTDLLIVCPHYGTEYRHHPDRTQKRIVRLLFRHGANIILGAHPHLLQPIVYKSDKQLAIYSLGNFISTTLHKNLYTKCGVILLVDIEKNEAGSTRIKRVRTVPTWTRLKSGNGKSSYTILPIREYLKQSGAKLSGAERANMEAMLKHAAKIWNGGSDWNRHRE